jgi:hypothetical protein
LVNQFKVFMVGSGYTKHLQVSFHQFRIFWTSNTFVLVLFLCFVLPMQSQAQRLKQDAVFLKNGEMISGNILSQDSISGVKIENKCGIRIVPLHEIETIANATKAMVGFNKIKQGYYNYSSLALLFGEGRDGYIPIPSLTMVNGYNFNGNFLAGIGIGYEYYDFAVMPLFLSAQYYFRSDFVTPFASMRLGYSIPLESTYNQGWYYEKGKTHGGVSIAPELGVSIPAGSRSLLTVAVGYHHQQLSYDTWEYSWFRPEQGIFKKITTHYNRVSLRLGLTFF